MKIQKSIALTPKQWDKLKLISKEEQISMGELIRDIINKYLEVK